ncbi:MAG: hypothetical protein JST83_14655 [Bacteroidetes bacterium]|nr:hypothetical protein [Bacteroidota bacterium]
MEYKIEVLPYSPESGIQLKWDAEFEIDVRRNPKEIVIIANQDGLRSLARHLLTLAQDNVPSGAHIHLDEANSLESGSIAIVLEKK